MSLNKRAGDLNRVGRVTGLQEITSTEKLLDLIRKKDGSPSSGPGENLRHPSSVREFSLKGSKGTFSRFKYFRGPSTVGVDLGSSSLRMVKTRGTDSKKNIEDWKIVPYPPDLERNSTAFADFLKRTLTAFCGAAASVRLWAFISSVNVEIRQILVPKVQKKQLAQVIYWSAKKELGFNEEERIFDYEIRGDVYDQGIAKLAVMVYSAPRQEVEEAKRLFAGIGWPLSGITIVPFAIQNILRTKRLDVQAQQIAMIFVGNDFSRIDIFDHGSLVMSRDVKTGMNSLVEALLDGYNEKAHPSSSPAPRYEPPDKTESPPSSDRQGEGLKVSLTHHEARDLLFNLLSQREPDRLTRYLLNQEEMLALITPALDRLSRQIVRTFEYFMQTTQTGRIEKVYFSSVMEASKLFFDYMEEKLGLEVVSFDFPFFSIPQDDGLSWEEKIVLLAAFGLSLSDNAYTPNMIYTYREKLEAEAVTSINRIIFISFITLVVICTGIFFSLNQAVAKKKIKLERLEAEMAQFQPPVDENLILKQLEKVKKLKERTIAYGNRHLAMALVAELAQLTPPALGLLSVKMSFPMPAPPAKETSAAKAPSVEKVEKGDTNAGSVILEGLSVGDVPSAERELNEYILKLNGSPLFAKANIEKSVKEKLKNREVLRFTVTVDVR